MKKYTYLIIGLFFCGFLFAETEQPIYDVTDPAVNENFRSIYLVLDQHKHNQDGSSLLLMHANGSNSTLGSGTTFYAFVTSADILLRKVTATIIVAGVGGNGDRWICGIGTDSIFAISPAASGAGTIHVSTGGLTVPVLQGTTVYFRLSSTASPTPTANIDLEYSMR